MTVTDQIGQTITIPDEPLRIISLVPSQTELLHYLGLEDEVVGITKFCIYPDNWFRSKTRIGGTKQHHFDKIDKLKPNLIIANKEENDKSQIEALASNYPVWTSDISNLEEAYEMIQQIGIITHKEKEAALLIDEIKKVFSELSLFIQKQQKKFSVVYLIWQNPMMSIGSDTFIHHLLEEIGFINLLADKSRYPIITEAELKELTPDLILLSSEPYPFKDKHINAFQNICPDSDIMLVDGESFSWYGSRLLYAVDYFRNFVKRLTE